MNTLRLGSSYLLHEALGGGAMGQVWRGSIVAATKTDSTSPDEARNSPKLSDGQADDLSSMSVRTLGGYVLLEMLGRGAMGQVWRGSDGSGSDVAIKVMRSELMDDPDMVKRFERERSIMLSIHHPCVVAVRDLVVEGDTMAIVMDLVEGTDLRRYLAKAGTLRVPQALRFTGQVLAGLDAVHKAGILHRDLKPENILIDTSSDRRPPVARLSDFGIARFTDGATLTRLSQLIGTPQYLAPESIRDGTFTAASDLYASGIVLYELLAGRPPFTASHPAALLRKHVEDPPIRPEGMPDDIWSFVERLLDKEPAGRPPSAEAAARECGGLARKYRGAAALPPLTDQLPEEPAVVAVSPVTEGEPEVATLQPAEVPKPAPHDPPDANRPVRPSRRGRRRGSAVVLAGAACLGLLFSLWAIFGRSGDREPELDTGVKLGDIDEVAPAAVDPPPRQTELNVAVSNRSFLELEKSTPNLATADDEQSRLQDSRDWFRNNGLTDVAPMPNFDAFYASQIQNLLAARGTRFLPERYRGVPLNGVVDHKEGTFYLFGPQQGVRYLASVGKDDQVRYVFDFINFGRDQGGEETLSDIRWAQEEASTLFIASDGGLMAIDLGDRRVRWRSSPILSVGSNFAVSNGLIYSGYNCECDSNYPGGPFVVHAGSGRVLQALEIDSWTEWFFVKGQRLYLRGGGFDYVFKITGEKPPKPRKQAASGPNAAKLSAVTPIAFPSYSQVTANEHNAVPIFRRVSSRPLPLLPGREEDPEHFTPELARHRSISWLQRHGLEETRPELMPGFSPLADVNAAIPMSYRGHRLVNVVTRPKRWYLEYGDNPEGEVMTKFLFGVDRTNGDVIFAYEQNGSERLIDFAEADGVVVVRSYRRSDATSPPEHFLTALEVGFDRVLWRRANDGILMDGNKDFVVTGCCDPYDVDRPTQLEAFAVRSGASFLPQALDGSPEQIAVRDNLVYVNLGSREQTYELTDRD